MRATPESSNSPRSRASAAVSGRIAVPALPRKSLAGARGARPPRPVMCTLLPASSTAQPIWRNASSITRVSSGAGSQCTVVVPLLSAASSSTRLEMLLEPRNRTSPAAASNAGRSMKAGVYMARRPAGYGGLRVYGGAQLGRFLCAHARVGTGLAGQGQQVFQRLGMAFFHGLLDIVQRLPEPSRLDDQFMPVGQQYVAPHLGVAGRDAGEVAKAGA